MAPAPHAPAYDGLRATAQVVLGSAAALFATRVLFIELGANTTDKVTSWLYDLTAWPGTASLQPRTGAHLTDWVGLGYLLLCVVAWKAADRMRRRGSGAATRSSSVVSAR
jgi:hypothetical protein